MNWKLIWTRIHNIVGLCGNWCSPRMGCLGAAIQLTWRRTLLDTFLSLDKQLTVGARNRFSQLRWFLKLHPIPEKLQLVQNFKAKIIYLLGGIRQQPEATILVWSEMGHSRNAASGHPGGSAPTLLAALLVESPTKREGPFQSALSVEWVQSWAAHQMHPC